MIVNIDKLCTTNAQLNRALDSYQESINNLYNIYKNIDSSWHDSDSYRFSVQTSFEHTKILKYCNELKNLTNYYNKIIKLYSPIGKSININIEIVPDLLNKLNICIELIKKVISRFQTINIKLVPNIKKEANEIEESFNRILSLLNILTDNIRNMEKTISENEDLLHNELLKFDISEIKVDYE